jgi:hypothetical protein
MARGDRIQTLSELFHMDASAEYERNSAAYRRIKVVIKATYPHGWFVGIADEQIIDAAASFRELETQLRTRGRDTRNVLVVEAGVDYPEYASIFI